MPPTLLHYTDVETALDRPERLARLSGLVEELRDDRTVVVGTGDDTAPGALPLVTDGRAALDLFEAVEPAADVPGNHDFDAGIDAARRTMREAPMPFLAANLRGGTGDGSQVIPPPVEPWTVVEVGDEQVGLVGIAHPDTADINPEAAGVRFEPALPAARDAIAAVRDRVDHVVVLAHLGTGAGDGPGGRDLARELDVAAVLDGHRHEAVTTVVDGTPYARAGQGAEWLIALDLAGGTLVRHPVDAGPVDEALAGRVRERAREAGLTEVVAEVEEPIRCDRPAVRAAESRVGNLVVDAYRRVGGADVALIAPAAVRAGPDLSGTVTVWDLLRLVPFRDDLVTLSVDGGTLRETLARVSGDVADAWQGWYFGHVSGCSLRYDQEACELLAATVDGEPLDPGATYRVATTDYYVRTEHLLPGLTPDLVVDRHGPQHEAVRADVTANGLDVRLSGRVERPGFDGVPDP